MSKRSILDKASIFFINAKIIYNELVIEKIGEERIEIAINRLCIHSVLNGCSRSSSRGHF